MHLTGEELRHSLQCSTWQTSQWGEDMDWMPPCSCLASYFHHPSQGLDSDKAEQVGHACLRAFVCLPVCLCWSGKSGGSCYSMDMEGKVEDNLGSLPHTLLETVFVVYYCVCQASWEASGSLLCQPPPPSRSTDYLNWLYICFRNSNSGPHACIASMLPNEQSSQP